MGCCCKKDAKKETKCKCGCQEGKKCTCKKETK